MIDASQIGKRAWSYAGVLQQAGLSCVEYVEQLTMLLYLKMADQLTEEPYNQKPIVPPELGWKALLKRDKLSLDLFWIKDKSLTDTDSLPAPDIIAFTSTPFGLNHANIRNVVWKPSLQWKDSFPARSRF